MAYLTDEDVFALVAAAESGGLLDPGVRDTLLEGIDRGLIGTLPIKSQPGVQLRSDLRKLNDMDPLDDGSVPLSSWLKNAISILGRRSEAAVFIDVAERLGIKGIPRPAPVVRPAPAPMTIQEPAPAASPAPAAMATPAPVPVAKPAPPPLTILFLGANPADTTRLGLDHELRAIQTELDRAPGERRLDLRSAWAVRVSDLTDQLYRFRPSILHFSGHGSPQGQLLFEDEIGDVARVDAADIAALLGMFTPALRCVVLSACYSERVAREIVERVDAVVGMAKGVNDDSATVFTQGLYQAISRGDNLATAVEMGRLQIRLRKMGTADVPVALAREGVRLEELVLIPPA